MKLKNLESRLEEARKATGEKVSLRDADTSQVSIYKKLTPPEFRPTLGYFFSKLELDENTPRHNSITALGEVEKFSGILDEMQTCSCRLYAEFGNEMQEQLDLLATNMDSRIQKIQEYGKQSDPSHDDEAKMKLSLDEGKNVMAQGEANLVRLEDRLGGTWSMINRLDEALIWLEELDAILKQFLAGEIVDFLVLINSLLRGLEKMNLLFSLITNNKFELRTPVMDTECEDPTIEPSFGAFKKLPPELKYMILEAAAPSPRIVTRHSRDTINELSATNSLTRYIIEKKYGRMVNPVWTVQGIDFPHSTTTYVNFETDTVLKTMMVYPSERRAEYVLDNTLVTPSIFDMDNSYLESGSSQSRSLRRFTGLSKVKHLALSSVFMDPTEALFSILQVCCPELKTITLCYTEVRLFTRFSQACDIQFLDFDYNHEDYVWSHWERMDNGKDKPSGEKINIRAWKRIWKNRWGQKMLHFRVWENDMRQDFQDYCEKYGMGWAPALRVCFMTTVSADGCRYIFSDGLNDRPEESALGEYVSILDSFPLTDKEGNFLSRYDGIEDLFREAEE